jgi:hypothetical protein
MKKNKKRLRRRLKHFRSKHSHHLNIEQQYIPINKMICLDCNSVIYFNINNQNPSRFTALHRRAFKKNIRALNKLKCLSKDERNIKEIIE